MWKALCHPNILPLIGVTATDTQFVMVMEWMVNGNINEFLRAHTDVDRLELVRIPSKSCYSTSRQQPSDLHSWEMLDGGWTICTTRR